MTPERSEAVFGAFDGLVSLLGVLAGAIVAHASNHVILLEAAGLAVASAVGMAAGDYLAGKAMRLSAVMGLATLLGSIVPAVPVLLAPGTLGRVLAGVLVVAMGVGIAEVRSQETGRRRGYTTTGAVLLLASGLSVAVSLLLGVAG